MADDAKKGVAFERVLDYFKLQNLKDSQQEALQNLVKGLVNVFIIQTAGSGSLRHRQGQLLTRPAVCSGRITDSEIVQRRHLDIKGEKKQI